ncbi:hypothetical protein ACGFIV_18385 [Sphaerisporangium sp. NPDC049003]|uniref:hypothetical protein n=1 Tax=Sphaerisporangium sp. NPDC049003 TaxID=3364517 RepID=UPI00371653F4
MLGLTSPVKLRRKAAVLALLTPLSLTACTSDKGPTAAQAGQTLKAHILQLLKERNAKSVTISDPGGKDIPCAEGKAKQTYAATGRDLEAGTAPDALNDMMLGAVKRVGDYSIVDGNGGIGTVTVADNSTATVLLLNSHTKGEYSIRGETECLRPS